MDKCQWITSRWEVPAPPLRGLTPPAGSIADAIPNPPGIPRKERAKHALKFIQPVGLGDGGGRIRKAEINPRGPPRERQKTRKDRFSSLAGRGVFALPQSVLARCFEGGALVQVVFGEKAAPGASWRVLWPDLGARNSRFGG